MKSIEETLSTNINNTRWLVTGVAGFIGSHLLEKLLSNDQEVVGLDNFSTGHRTNLDDVKSRVSSEQWQKFSFLEGDIRDLNTCLDAFDGIDFCLHQAALGSVPRSIVDPASTHDANVTGTLNILLAAKEKKAKRLVYASSSSVYGDDENSPKLETQMGRPLSPYALSKTVNEQYAQTFSRNYGLQAIGLRYFNVFGARQDPNGAYAAVIPRWTSSLLKGEVCEIYGDGETSRDFSYIDNIVQANILAATTDKKSAIDFCYNVGFGDNTTLNELYQYIAEGIKSIHSDHIPSDPEYKDFRAGDVRHSQADISLARQYLAYNPEIGVAEGIKRTIQWYSEPKETSGCAGGI